MQPSGSFVRSPDGARSLSGRACRQHGQVFPVALAGLLLATLMMLVMFNAGSRVTDRSAVVNAADAAAYGAGVWAARQLNFMAYTNRAMIANHVGVGHFVAYMSWIRYVADVAQKIDTVAQFFPVVNAVSAALRDLAEAMRDLAEAEGELFVPAVDKLNSFYAAAQLEAEVFLDPAKIAGVMQATAERFDPDVRINAAGAIAGLSESARTPINEAIRFQDEELGSFVERLDVSERNGEFVKLTELTFGGFVGPRRGSMSRDWLLDREDNPFLRSLFVRKRARTRHLLNDTEANWRARDRLRRRRIARPDVTLARGSASAQEFASNYRGIEGYYNLELDRFGIQVLRLLAYASKPQTTVQSVNVLGLQDSESPLSGLSMVHVEYTPPERTFLGLRLGLDRFDSSNLYNPYWAPRLVGTNVFDISRAFPDIDVDSIEEFK